MFAVVLDTCVLWPSLQRDFLLSLAIEGLYRPLWSSAVLAELEEHEGRKLVRRGTAQIDAARAAQHLISQLNDAFDDACVEGWEPLEGSSVYPTWMMSALSRPLACARPPQNQGGSVRHGV